MEPSATICSVATGSPLTITSTGTILEPSIRQRSMCQYGLLSSRLLRIR